LLRSAELSFKTGAFNHSATLPVDARLILTARRAVGKPMRYGPEFMKPAMTVMRKHRAKAGPKMCEAKETVLAATPTWSGSR
jgi:hypothetical protein